MAEPTPYPSVLPSGDELVGVVERWPGPALLSDAAGTLVAASVDARRLLGLPAPPAPLPVLRDLVGIGPADRALAGADTSELPVPGAAPGGDPVLVSARCARTGDGGLLVVLTGAADEHRLRRSLEQAERLASVGELLSSVAHELTNPLTAVLGYAEVLLAEDQPGLPRDDIERIRKEASRCRRIVGNLLDLSRADALEMRPILLRDIVAKVVEFREYAAQVSNVELVTEQADDLPPVEGDFHRLVQAVLNLVTNAEYAVADRASGRRVVLRTLGGEETASLEVEDNGPGVPDAIKDAVFQPFFTTKPRGKGTGLGLSLVRATAESHGGSIRVEDAPGSGARFVLTLPLARD